MLFYFNTTIYVINIYTYTNTYTYNYIIIIWRENKLFLFHNSSVFSKVSIFGKKITFSALINRALFF